MRQLFQKYFSFHTIKGKIFWMAFTFSGLLVILSILVIHRNGEVKDAYRTLSEKSFPLVSSTSTLLEGIEQTASLQREFLIYGEPSLAKKRQSIWEKTILPNLEPFKEQLSGQDTTLHADSLVALILTFKEKQQQVEELIMKKAAVLDGNNVNMGLNLMDTALVFVQLSKAIDAHETEAEIKAFLRNELIPIQANLISQLRNIRHEHKALVAKGIQTVESNIGNARLMVAVFSFLVFLIGSLLAYFLIKGVTTSMKGPVDMLQRLAAGELPEKMPPSRDELNLVVEAGNQLNENIEKASSFAINIGEGKLTDDFTPSSERDKLGNALVQMRDKLKKIAVEDKKRNWATEGLAHFSDIIRSHSDDVNTLSEKLISALVKYVGAIQGGIFILNEEGEKEKYLELIATYAFNRKKFLKKQLLIEYDYAEGLTGQAFLEGQTVYLTEIPDEYLEITSGLGDSNPQSLMIVPMKVNDDVEGVIEIASFEKFEPHHLQFVEKLGESIASSIISLKINDKTKKLLENSQIQTEQMRAQEEEMRQNMEELSATQEEMQRNTLEVEDLLKKAKEREANLLAENSELKSELEHQKEGESVIVTSENNQLPDLLTEIAANTPAVIFSFQFDTTTGNASFIFASPFLENLLGYQPDESYLWNFDQILAAIHADGKESFMEGWLQLINEAQDFHWTGRWKHKNGEWVLVRLVANARKQGENRVANGLITLAEEAQV